MKTPPKLSQAPYQDSTCDVQCSNNLEAQKIFENKISNSSLILSEDDRWLDSAEAAEFLRIGVPSLRNMTSNGQVIHYKLGRRNRYRLSDLKSLLLKNQRGGF